MSNHAAHAVWAERRAGRLPGRSVLAVALAMADWTNGNGEVYAGGRALAEVTGYGLATVQRAVHEIVGSGLYAEVVTGRGRRPSTYRLAISTWVASPVDNGDVATRHDVTTPDALVEVVTRADDVATHLPPRSDPFRAPHKEDTNTDTRFCAPHEVPTRVAELRARLNGSEP